MPTQKSLYDTIQPFIAEREPEDAAAREERLVHIPADKRHMMDDLAEQHLRQGEQFLKLKEFVAGLDENQQALSDRDKYLLFLERESRHDSEARRRYLLLTRDKEG